MALFGDLKRKREAEVTSGWLICNVRGSNGSGKSTVVRKVLKEYAVRKIKGVCGPIHPEAYELKVPGVKAPVFVLGTYERVTGGIDNIQPYDVFLDLLVKYIGLGHVVFEGLVTTGSYGRVMELLEPHAKNVILAYMDTPLDDCIANVMKRRDGREGLAVRNMFITFKRAKVLRRRMVSEGIFLRHEDISFDNGAAKVVQWLREYDGR